MEKERFEEAHRQWRDGHLAGRSGERRRRLEEGRAHAEKEMLKQVWWPAFGSLEHLHPEYEVTDFREGKRYIDLAYVRAPFKIAIEIDGYGPHVRDLSRRQFADQWVRHMHLINDGWIVVRIGYDDVKDRPRLWQQSIMQLVGRLYGERSSAESGATVGAVEDKEIVRLAAGLGGSIKLRDVRKRLGVGYRAARTILSRLERKGWLVPNRGGAARTHTWRLALAGEALRAMLS